MKEGLMVC